jgi:hypothetical protein
MFFRRDVFYSWNSGEFSYWKKNGETLLLLFIVPAPAKDEESEQQRIQVTCLKVEKLCFDILFFTLRETTVSSTRGEGRD